MSESYYYYCPYCGCRLTIYNDTCAACSREINPAKSLHSCDYYEKKGMEQYNLSSPYEDIINEKTHKADGHGVLAKGWYRILFAEEISRNPLYDKENFSKLYEYYKNRDTDSGTEGSESQLSLPENLSASSVNNNSQTQKYVPKCPICGSPNIDKIPILHKVLGAIFFGLFSNNAKCQFQCNNCEYKF